MRKLLIVLLATIAQVQAQKMCCMAMTPECLACGQDMSVEEYCQANPSMCVDRRLEEADDSM